MPEGERRLPACRVRQLAGRFPSTLCHISSLSFWTRPWVLRGTLPRTAVSAIKIKRWLPAHLIRDRDEATTPPVHYHRANSEAATEFGGTVERPLHHVPAIIGVRPFEEIRQRRFVDVIAKVTITQTRLGSPSLSLARAVAIEDFCAAPPQADQYLPLLDHLPKSPLHR